MYNDESAALHVATAARYMYGLIAHFAAERCAAIALSDIDNRHRPLPPFVLARMGDGARRALRDQARRAAVLEHEILEAACASDTLQLFLSPKSGARTSNIFSEPPRTLCWNTWNALLRCVASSACHN